MKRLFSSGLMIALIVSAFAVVSPTANGQGAGLVSSVLEPHGEEPADIEVAAGWHQRCEVQLAAWR